MMRMMLRRMRRRMAAMGDNEKGSNGEDNNDNEELPCQDGVCVRGREVGRARGAAARMARAWAGEGRPGQVEDGAREVPEARGQQKTAEEEDVGRVRQAVVINLSVPWPIRSKNRK